MSPLPRSGQSAPSGGYLASRGLVVIITKRLLRSLIRPTRNSHVIGWWLLLEEGLPTEIRFVHMYYS